MGQRAMISVVDDDESVRESLPDLLETLGFAARSFDCAQAFLASDALSDTRCLILDVSMPEMSGPELHDELGRRRVNVPVIFITGQCDRNVRAQALARGAVDCLFKPFSEEDLRSALESALGKA